MITVLNDKNKELYKAWFAEAGLALGKDAEYFTNIGQYYAHLVELEEKNPKFMMLPLDEDPFEINANTRAIKIPASFAKGSAVREDANSEMIVFTIDRYFDFTDLLECTAYVQWVLPDENHTEGVSAVIVDETTLPGKLRLGWLITEDIAQYAGKVKFAVRFFKKDTANNKYTYVFNTLPAEIAIQAGLEFEGTDLEPVDLSDLFKTFITNSQNPDYIKATAPWFAAPAGQNLPSTAALENDTCTLVAEAYTTDLGALSYEWHYEAPENVTVTGSFEERGIETKVEFREILNPTTKVANKAYYIKADDGGATYIPFTKSFEELEDGQKVYEKVTLLTIKPLEEGDKPEDKVIVGKYWVEATNTVTSSTPGKEGEWSNTASNTSNKCIIAKPDALVVKTAVSGTKVMTNGVAELKGELIAPTAGSNVVYKMQFSDVSAESVEVATPTVQSTNSFSATAAGWYKLSAETSLNRFTEIADLGSCRVVEPIVAPTVAMTYAINGESKGAINGTITDTTAQDIVTLTASIGDFPIDNKLKSDGITYEWFVMAADTEFVPAVANPAKGPVFEINDNIITVDGEPGYAYKCVVTNILADQTASGEFEAIISTTSAQ